MEMEQKNEEEKKNELKEEEEEMEEEEEEEEEMVPRFIPKSERVLSRKEEEKKANNNIKNDKKEKNSQIINKNKNEEKMENKNNNKNDNKDNKKKDDSKDTKGPDNKEKDDKDINKDNENSKDNKEEINKTKNQKENDILTDNILSIRNSLDKIQQKNIKYLIDLEKKKNEAKKHTIVDLDEDEPEDNNNNTTNKFVKQKKLKSKQEKIYIHLPDDTDDQNDINEYNNWKERELKRIKRDIEKYESFIKEQEEIKKRRLMTESEIKEDNIRLGADSTKNRFRSKISFLQKYYHKGVFFQDEAEDDPNHVYNRDFNLPTWEDTIDKTNLPKLLAKRRGNVWRKSQSKYTHLNDADTTNFDKNFVVPENILAKIQRLSKKK